MELRLVITESENYLCDRYEVVNCEGFNQLVEAVDHLEQEFTDHKFLVTLDNLGQACYTSMHAKMSHDLDSTEGESLDHLPPECFEEDGCHRGYFGCKAEFNIQRSNIEKKLVEYGFDDVCKKGISLYCEYEKDCLAANKDPKTILDSRIYILKVPVEHCYQTLYAFPNGYFQCDLNPFETIVLARTMQEKFGYELIGIGASHMAYRKSRALNLAQTQELIELLSQVYSDDFDMKLRKSLSGFIKNKGILILSYTE